MAPPTALEAPPTAEPSPQSSVSAELIEHGRAAVDSGNSDAALRLFERAIELDPGAGEAYYWLAEVWLVRGDATQALSYHQLAHRYLEADERWSAELAAQASRLEEEAR